MKKNLILSILLLVGVLFNVNAQQSSQENNSGFNAYKPVYFITGLDNLIPGFKNDQVKVQISFMYDFFSPFRIKAGFFAAYSQIMFWKLYEFSSPFKDITFNPEFFWRFESKNNFLDNLDLIFVDYFQFGFWEHLSNGKDGLSSRGYDRCYAQLQLGLGDAFKFGINFKYFYVFPNSSDNPDIQDYIGSFESKVFCKWRDMEYNINQEEIYCRFGAGGGTNGLDFTRGFQEVGFMTRPIFATVRVYCQFYHGYGESLLEYNQEGFSLRVGVLLE